MAAFLSRTYTSFDGLSLYYRDYVGPRGAPTVLCLPGLTRNSRDFEELALHLSSRFRVLCADLRGRGRSDFAKDPMTYLPAVYVQDMAALLNSAGLMSVAVVGTSLGGIMAMIMAALMPHRLRGVVLNDVGPELDAAGMGRIAQFVGKAVPLASWEDAAAAVQRGEAAIYPDFTANDWMREARHRFVAMPDGRVRADYDMDIAKPFAVALGPVNLWPFFAALRTIPTLGVRGAASDLLSAQVFARMKDVKPDMEQVTVPNRGHVPLLDEPEILPILDRFLENLPRRVGVIGALRRRFGARAFMAAMQRQAAR